MSETKAELEGFVRPLAVGLDALKVRMRREHRVDLEIGRSSA